MLSKNREKNMPFHYILAIMISFSMTSLLSSSEERIHPGQEEHASFFKQMNSKNEKIGKLDSQLFREYLSDKLVYQDVRHVARNVHNQILECGSIIDKGDPRTLEPFCISFYSKDKLNKLKYYLRQKAFVSENRSNRIFSKDNPKATSIDHCSYVLKSNGRPTGIICCFFNREVILKSFMKFIRNYEF